jgi:hypothetical protein
MQAAKDFAASVPGATGKVQCEHGNDDWLKCNIFRANEMPLSVTCDNSLCVTFNGEPPHHNTTVIYTPPASGR